MRNNSSEQLMKQSTMVSNHTANQVGATGMKNIQEFLQEASLYASKPEGGKSQDPFVKQARQRKNLAPVVVTRQKNRSVGGMQGAEMARVHGGKPGRTASNSL